MKLISKITSTPKLMFLVDALGALISFLSLLLILVPLERHFGIPVNLLYYLGAIAVCLFIYSFSCHKLIKTNWKPYLKIIISLNAAYSLLSIGLILVHYQTLRPLAFAYLVLELAVIACMIALEYKTLRQLSSSTSASSSENNISRFSKGQYRKRVCLLVSFVLTQVFIFSMTERQVNLAYYRPQDWTRLLSITEDRKDLHDTWEEWHQEYLATMKKLRSMGLHVNQFTIDLDELVQYCFLKGMRITSSARSQFVGRSQISDV